MKITHALLGEHGVLYALLEPMASGTLKNADVATWHATLRMLESALISHARIEEDLLFPALAARGLEAGPLPVMRHEHQEIERLLAAALAASVPARIADHVAALVPLVLDHFHKEEMVLFGMAEQLLGESGLLELGATWAQRRDVHVAR